MQLCGKNSNGRLRCLGNGWFHVRWVVVLKWVGSMSHRYAKEVAPIVRCVLGPLSLSSHGEENMFRISIPRISCRRYLHDKEFLGIVGVGKDLEINLMDQSFAESTLIYVYIHLYSFHVVGNWIIYYIGLLHFQQNNVPSISHVRWVCNQPTQVGK